MTTPEIAKVKKRDGSIVDFEQDKISKAIFKALTVTGEGDEKLAEKLAERVIKILNRRFSKREIPDVEQIQDIVEEVLMLEDLTQTAKNYIIYREQRRRMRETETIYDEAVEIYDKYINEIDWQVKENANMSYSLQGLNNYGVATLTKRYWLNKIYPQQIREAAASGDFHIHDLDFLGAYCCGWDLYDLLKRGFGGVAGKVESKPPKHLRTALGQVVNFFYTLQGECYSADTEVLTKNGWKRFFEVENNDEIFTLNNQTQAIELQKPTRFFEFDYNGQLYNFRSKKFNLMVTPNHNMVVDQYCPSCSFKRVNALAGFQADALQDEYGENNIKTATAASQMVFSSERMSSYYRRFVKAQDFNPNSHFIPKQGLWLGRDEEYFALPAIEVEMYSPFTGNYRTKKIEVKLILMDDWLSFFGFWLAEGCVSLRKRDKREGRTKPYFEYQVRISQNKGETAEMFETLLRKLPFHYNKKERGKKLEFLIQNKQLFLYLKNFGGSGDKFIPQEYKNLSKRQLNILFDWMMRGDGHQSNGLVEYSTKSTRLADDMQEIALKLGWSANIYIRRKGEFSWYDVGISRAKRFRFRSSDNIQKVDYQGKVYCVEVPNHTLYVRRNGKACWCGNSAGAQAFSNFDTLLAPFIRYDKLEYHDVKQAMQEFLFGCAVPTRVGFQTPFSNITVDITPSPSYAKQPVIIGGELQKETYGEFGEEMKVLNKAFFEAMMEGDKNGRVFSVDADCLCPIKNSEKIKLVKIGDYIDKLMEKRKPMFIKENNCEVLDVKDLGIKCLGLKGQKIDWQQVNFLVRHPFEQLLQVQTQGGFNIKLSPSHSVFILQDGQICNVKALNLRKGDYLISPKTIPAGENKTSVISLAEEFVKKQKAEGVYMSSVLKDGEKYQEKRVALHKRNYGKGEYQYARGAAVFPLSNIASNIKEFDFSKAELNLAGSALKMKNVLSISPELVEFLGWYCAEGSAEKSAKYGGISLGLNLKKERQTAEHIINLVKEIWPGLPVALREIEERNLVEVRIHAKLLRRVITEVFELGNGKKRKVPQIIFELPNEMKKIFLNAYFQGDAWLTDNIMVNSISRELIYGVSTLLKQLGVFHTLTEYQWEGRPRWRVNVFRNRDLEAKDSHTISKIPIKESGLEGVVEMILRLKPHYQDSLGRNCENTKNGVFHHFGIDYFTSDSTSIKKAQALLCYARELGVEISDLLQGVEKGNFSFFRVKRVEETKTSNGMVYDFSTESESFVADQLLVHNTFPIPTVNITHDFPWDDPFLEPMWLATAKYGICYFANFLQSEMKPEEVRSMCCRLRLNNKELLRRGGGLFGANPLTGSSGVVTINMSRLGYLSKTKKEFFERLERVMDLAKESLEIKKKAIDDLMRKGLYPYSKYYLQDVEKMRGSHYGNHFLTIGILGMNECLLNFMGEDIGSVEGRKFTLEVMDSMRERIVKYQEETGNLYNLESTPAEGASFKLALKDREKYPEIITAGTTEVPYYTNSTQLPVNYTDDIFQALDLQDDLQCKYSGGTVLHLFIGEQLRDLVAMKSLIKKIFSNYKLPYITLTPTFSICPSHGYLSGEHWQCPKCTIEQTCEVYSRIVGYIRPVQQWHKGKTQEFKERKTFQAPQEATTTI